MPGEGDEDTEGQRGSLAGKRGHCRQSLAGESGAAPRVKAKLEQGQKEQGWGSQALRSLGPRPVCGRQKGRVSRADGAVAECMRRGPKEDERSQEQCSRG